MGLNHALFRKLGSFGAYWMSFMLIFILILSGAKKFVLLLNPSYMFSEFWTWDIIGIVMIATGLLSVWITKRATDTKEAFFKIWNFGIAWTILMVIGSVILFGSKTLTLYITPDYHFSEFWTWDIIGIMMLATCAISFFLTRKPHAKKQ